MRIHLIGHASLLFETADRRILMDPVLGAHHQEGLFEVFPPRRVDLAAMPTIDTIVISHRHLDHFDIPSLAALPRDVQVLIPRDPLIQRCLERLGFRRVVQLRAWSTVTLGETTLMTTASRAPIAEFGLVVSDASAVCWNLVDSVISPDIITVTRSRFPAIDILLATWQPLLEGNLQTFRPLSFPFDTYEELLAHIALIEPAVVVPGSNGYVHRGASAWLDAAVFPVTRERFCEDVRRTCPALDGQIFALDPGDVLALNGSSLRIEVEGSPFVAREDPGRERLDFSPVEPRAALVDDDPLGLGDERLLARVEPFAVDELPAMIAARPHAFAEHRRLGVRHQLEVVLPGGDRRRWWYDLGEDPPRARPGRDPLATSFGSITASGLVGLLDGEHSYNRLLLGGYMRSFQTALVATPAGVVRPRGRTLPDPLCLCIPDNPAFERARDREIERWLATRAG